MKSIPPSGKLRKTLICALGIFLALAASFPLKWLTRKYLVHTVYSTNNQLATTMPKGKCGLIKIPDRNLQIDDPVAYFHRDQGTEMIFAGLIKALPKSEYQSPRQPGNVISVPDEHYFVEVEGEGLDSNILGPVAGANIIGKISEVISFERAWYSSVFFGVPNCQ